MYMLVYDNEEHSKKFNMMKDKAEIVVKNDYGKFIIKKNRNLVNEKEIMLLLKGVN